MTTVYDMRFQQHQNLPELQKDILRFKTIFYFKVQEKTISTCLSQLSYLTRVQEQSEKEMSIPIAGGYTYSPDFTYVLGQQHLNLIMETKYKEKSDSFSTEQQKRATAQESFKQLNPNGIIRVEAQDQGQKNKGRDPFLFSREGSMSQNERF